MQRSQRLLLGSWGHEYVCIASMNVIDQENAYTGSSLLVHVASDLEQVFSRGRLDNRVQLEAFTIILLDGGLAVLETGQVQFDWNFFRRSSRQLTR